MGAIQLQKLITNPENLKAHEIHTSLKLQVSQLFNIQQEVHEVTNELAKLETQFAEVKDNPKRKTEISLNHQNSKDFLIRIDSLSAEIETAAEKGSISAAEDVRIQELDEARHALKSGDPSPNSSSSSQWVATRNRLSPFSRVREPAI